MSKAETKRNIQIERRLEEYRPFWDDGFGKDLHAASAHHPQLDLLALDLELNWRSSAYAAATPYIFVSTLEGYSAGLANAIEPSGSALTYSVSILSKLRSRVPALASDQKLADTIRTELLQISAEIVGAKHSAKEKVGSGFSREQAWNEFIQAGAFQISARASVQLAFIGTWNAYEEFVVHVAKLVLGLSRLRSGSDKFEAALDDAFGQGASHLLWFNDTVTFYREVRNSLVHAGGRIVGGLEAFKGIIGDKLPLQDGRIDIFPQHIRHMYELLKPSVLSICRSPKVAGLR